MERWTGAETRKLPTRLYGLTSQSTVTFIVFFIICIPLCCTVEDIMELRVTELHSNILLCYSIICIYDKLIEALTF